MSRCCDGQDSCKWEAQMKFHPLLWKKICTHMKNSSNISQKIWIMWLKLQLKQNWNHLYKVLLCYPPFRRSWARTASNFRALRKRSSRESGLSPNCSNTSLAKSSPSAALSFITALRSLSDDTRFSLVSFSSSLAWRTDTWLKNTSYKRWTKAQFMFNLLHSVTRQFVAWPKHRPMILYCQVLQLGPHCLLLLWHHAERSRLHKN